ncbi:MAG: hypothetical protein Q8N14_06460 [Candidatus Omnitrophota bacterium]|nr:hypothetical protein [Candidatus Omnitrophota bacterium]
MIIRRKVCQGEKKKYEKPTLVKYVKVNKVLEAGTPAVIASGS